MVSKINILYIRVIEKSVTINHAKRNAMSNRKDKPKMSAADLVKKMRDEKGITFNLVSEVEAERHLSDINNYFRTASYRKNYQKYQPGANQGKYIDLDFGYLCE